jgi:hypothetical protein
MLNNVSHKPAFAMHPNGSLNHLPVNTSALPNDDPLRNIQHLTGKDLVSRKALITILKSTDHPLQQDLRAFLSSFDPERPADHTVLKRYAIRFTQVIKTARNYTAWASGNQFEQRLYQHWQASKTIVIAGGITSGLFGIHLASIVEESFNHMDVLASPWAGQTALFGLAQAVGQREDLLVMDFGGTGVKCGIAYHFGNKIEPLFELEVEPYKQQGLIYPDGFNKLLMAARKQVRRSLPVAISLACYMDDGIVFKYKSGIYYPLGQTIENLAKTLNDQWLPAAGFQELKTLQHDSTAAAMAFQFTTPAMMVTLGTGLGSAPCPCALP